MDQSVEAVENIRKKIIEDPETILEDRDVMRALVAANSAALGENIVDLRGIALSRLENRLDRLEDTHRSVIAAAYENLAGTNMIHRAILRILEPTDFAGFLGALGDIAEIMRVDAVRLVLETGSTRGAKNLDSFKSVLVPAGKGEINQYLGVTGATPDRIVTLRQIIPKDDAIYGPDHDWICSEACLRLDFGPGRLPGLLLLASEDPHQFKPSQGSDLLEFLAGVFQRAMVRWLD